MNKTKILSLLLIAVLATFSLISCGPTTPKEYSQAQATEIYTQIDGEFLGGQYIDENDTHHIVLTKPVQQVIKALKRRGGNNALALEALKQSLTKNAPKQPVFDQGRYTLQQLQDTVDKLTDDKIWTKYDIQVMGVNEQSNKVEISMHNLTPKKEDELHKIVEELTGHTSILEFEELNPDMKIVFTLK